MKINAVIASVLVAALATGACVRKPVTAPRAVVPELVTSELRAAGTQAKQFGHMTTIGVGISNGSTNDYVVRGDRVYAVDKAGNRVAPLSVEEAARQAGGTTALVGGLRGAGGGALLAGLLGALAGATAGITGGGRSSATGAAVGAGVGIIAGAVGGFYTSKTQTEKEIIAQLGGLYLTEHISKPGFPVSGFVFFPEGEYAGVYVVVQVHPNGPPQEVFGKMVPVAAP